MNPKAALYVMGAIDELGQLGIVEIAGDEPLTSHDDRKEYRRMKRDGYTPTMDEIDRVLSACVAEQAPMFRRLFEGIVKEGWDTIKKMRAEHRADEAADGPDEFFRSSGSEVWIPL